MDIKEIEEYWAVSSDEDETFIKFVLVILPPIIYVSVRS